MTMTTQGCPLHETLVQDVTRYAKKVPGVNNVKVDIVWEPKWTMDSMTEEGKAKIKNMTNTMTTPAPINYETALPQGVGKLVQQEDGSMVLANEHEQGFIIDWCRSSHCCTHVFDFCFSFFSHTIHCPFWFPNNIDFDIIYPWNFFGVSCYILN